MCAAAASGNRSAKCEPLCVRLMPKPGPPPPPLPLPPPPPWPWGLPPPLPGEDGDAIDEPRRFGPHCDLPSKESGDLGSSACDPDGDEEEEEEEEYGCCCFCAPPCCRAIAA